MTEDVFARHAKKILTNQKTLHIMKRLAVKSQNEGATSDAETLHNMKRLFIRAICARSSGIEKAFPFYVDEYVPLSRIR